MVSQAKIDANRRNARRSTGPRTSEGKERARFNALKHGATAQIPVLPGEDPAAFLELVADYKADFNPKTRFERDMVERLALVELQYVRANRVDVARTTEKIMAAANQAESLGQRLFFDRRGPIAAYPNREFHHLQKRTSSADVAEDPDNPARLVKALQSTGPGCRWLLDRWAELRARLEAGECWHSPEKLKAIRLLGQQPVEAALVRDVRDVFQATYVIDPHHSHAFYELRCDLDNEALKQQLKTLKGSAIQAERPADAAAARALLLALVDRETGRLRPLAEAHRLQEQPTASAQLSPAAIDNSPEGERLKRYNLACERATHRIYASITKFRKDFGIDESDPLDPADAAYAPVTGRANGYRQDEPTDVWHDRQNEPTADTDRTYDVDAAYREALEAARASLRNPGAGTPRINMDRLEQAILANVREAMRFDDLDNDLIGGTRCDDPQDQAPNDVAKREDRSAHAETGIRQNEPTDFRHDRQNEPTEARGSQQNEPTDAWEAHQNEPTEARGSQQNEPTGGWEARQNEPTDDDFEDLRDEATLDESDLRAEREFRRASAGLPRKRLEWFQMLEEKQSGTREPEKRRPAFPSNDRKHRRNRRARNQMQQRGNGVSPKVSPPGDSASLNTGTVSARASPPGFLR
jgi:hypothetical protein